MKPIIWGGLLTERIEGLGLRAYRSEPLRLVLKGVDKGLMGSIKRASELSRHVQESVGAASPWQGAEVFRER